MNIKMYRVKNLDSILYIVNNIFTMNNPDKNKLHSYGFRYSKIHSVDNCTVYKYTFPAYKHNRRTTLYGEILISIESGELLINVYDNTGTPYAPFYYIEYVKYDELQKIMSDNILNEICKISDKTGCVINIFDTTM